MTIERFIPNSFQISNAFVDEMMGELSGNAVKCYLIIVRKTRGWGKESDAIAISQFIDGKKLKDERTVRAALDELLAAGVVGKMDFKGRPSVYFLAKVRMMCCTASSEETLTIRMFDTSSGCGRGGLPVLTMPFSSIAA